MIRKCCVCQVVYGEKEPFEDKSETHGYCDSCFKVIMDGRKKEADGELPEAEIVEVL